MMVHTNSRRMKEPVVSTPTKIQSVEELERVVDGVGDPMQNRIDNNNNITWFFTGIYKRKMHLPVLSPGSYNLHTPSDKNVWSIVLTQVYTKYIHMFVPMYAYLCMSGKENLHYYHPSKNLQLGMEKIRRKRWQCHKEAQSLLQGRCIRMPKPVCQGKNESISQVSLLSCMQRSLSIYLCILTKSWHVLPLLQGKGLQSSIFSSQRLPEKPLGQWHV